MKYCSNCSKTLEDHILYCPICGNQVVQVETESPANTEKIFTLPDEMDYQAPQAVAEATPSTRKRSLAILFAFLGGTLGIHSFYLGFTRKGVFQILSCFIGISPIWAIVDMLTMIFAHEFYDADGNIVL